MQQENILWTTVLCLGIFSSD